MCVQARVYGCDREVERKQKGSYRTNIPYIDLTVLQFSLSRLRFTRVFRARAPAGTCEGLAAP